MKAVTNNYNGRHILNVNERNNRIRSPVEFKEKNSPVLEPYLIAIILLIIIIIITLITTIIIVVVTIISSRQRFGDLIRIYYRHSKTVLMRRDLSGCASAGQDIP